MTAAGMTDQYLLEAGLEDWIPFPEARQTLERTLGPRCIDEMAASISRLVEQGRLQIYRGPWDDENLQVRVPDQEVPDLLADPTWFSYRLDEEHEERLFFVNVGNVRDS